MLRDHPADVHGKDERGRSPFWLAVLAGRAEMVELIASAGAVIEEEAADGATTLVAACYAGNQQVTKTLLDLGCNPEKLMVRPTPAPDCLFTCEHARRYVS
jgi:ankyrin repeat protein